MKPVYDVYICQTEEFDFETSIVFSFDELQKALNFIAMSLEQELLVQVKYNSSLDE